MYSYAHHITVMAFGVIELAEVTSHSFFTVFTHIDELGLVTAKMLYIKDYVVLG